MRQINEIEKLQQLGNKITEQSENIEFTLPLKKKYVSLLRLVVSAICVRMDCTYDIIEDVKLSVDEAFLLAIKQKGKQENDIMISFSVSPENIEINFPFPAEKPRKNSMGIFLINSLMDDITFVNDAGFTVLKMKKVIKERG